MRGKFEDLTGQTFGRLTVLRRSPENSKYRQAQWICQCSCENHTIVTVTTLSLKTGNTKSCGCLQIEAVKRTMSKWKDDDHDIISRFYGMKQRCYNQNCDKYPGWGGRGITICEAWLKDPRLFVEWARTNGYKPELTIDRIDNDGPYAPWNCRWVTKKVQGNNRRNNVCVTVNGETHTIKEWSQIISSSYDSMDRLHFLGRDDELRAFIADHLKRM